jgi:hypothetical protein
MKLVDAGFYFVHGSSQTAFETRVLIETKLLFLLHDSQKIRLVFFKGAADVLDLAG